MANEAATAVDFVRAVLDQCRRFRETKMFNRARPRQH